ncbi:hypothetical protein BGX31_011187 [Mortierella sp. GBA43]|nr:hypothetical protein BGX31_011187 [Mortierella sp. GBA43]
MVKESSSNGFEPKSSLQVPNKEHYVDQPIAPGSYTGAVDDSLPGADKAPLLFQPYTIKNLTIPNRVVVAPMCQFSSRDGFMGDYHLVHLGQFALGGAGLILIEASAVEARGRISVDDTGIWDDAHIPGIKRVADFVHGHGGKIGIQLAHAGRKSSNPAFYRKSDPSELWLDEVVGPVGNDRFDDRHHVPRELRLDEIPEFLSPATNKRTDQYGGSLENRARLLLEVIGEVRKNFPAEKPIFVRVSASDNIEHLDTPSWNIDQTVELAKLVRDAGVDVFHVSSGGNVNEQKVQYAYSYQVPFAERVKKEVPGLTVIAVGVITGGKQAEEILQEGQADLVAVARGFLRNPSFVYNAAKELNVRPRYISQYNMFLAKSPFY